MLTTFTQPELVDLARCYELRHKLLERYVHTLERRVTVLQEESSLDPEIIKSISDTLNSHSSCLGTINYKLNLLTEEVDSYERHRVIPSSRNFASLRTPHPQVDFGLGHTSSSDDEESTTSVHQEYERPAWERLPVRPPTPPRPSSPSTRLVEPTPTAGGYYRKPTKRELFGSSDSETSVTSVATTRTSPPVTRARASLRSKPHKKQRPSSCSSNLFDSSSSSRSSSAHASRSRKLPDSNVSVASSSSVPEVIDLT